MKKLKKLLEEIELPDTLYENAEEKYITIAKKLEKKIGNVKIYPQGSFSYGTTIKPYKDGQDRDYDIDLIMETDLPKDEYNGEDLLKRVKDELEEYDIEVFDKCITIHYHKDLNGYRFNLDVVPAVTENEAEKIELLTLGAKPEYVQYAVSIASTSKEDDEGWHTAIPKGYTEWFNEINKKIKQKIFEENYRGQFDKKVYASIEDVPRYKIKTPLQEVIELLKRFRDVFYSKKKENDRKPISAIITTIVANIVNNANIAFSTSELLFKVINDLKIYSNYNTLSESDFKSKYSNLIDIKKVNGEWTMINPVNPKDNLLDQWNKDSKIPELFFEWIQSLEKDLKRIIEYEDEDDYSNLFGSDIAKKVLKIDPVSKITIGAKPYGPEQPN